MGKDDDENERIWSSNVIAMADAAMCDFMVYASGAQQ